MPIFIDKNDFGLGGVGRWVMGQMGIHNPPILFYYDNISLASSRGCATFFESRIVKIGERSFTPDIGDELRIFDDDWRHVIYFDRKACVQSRDNLIENISYHAHELHHYRQYYRFRRAYKLMGIFQYYYNQITPRRVLNYGSNPVEHDAVIHEKRIVKELVGAAEYEKYLELLPTPKIKGSLHGVLKSVDESQPYDLEIELRKLLDRYWYAMPIAEKDQPLTGDESDLNPLFEKLHSLEMKGKK